MRAQKFCAPWSVAVRFTRRNRACGLLTAFATRLAPPVVPRARSEVRFCIERFFLVDESLFLCDVAGGLYLKAIELTSPNAGPSAVSENSTTALRSFHFPHVAASAPSPASTTLIFAISFT